MSYTAEMDKAVHDSSNDEPTEILAGANRIARILDRIRQYYRVQVPSIENLDITPFREIHVTKRVSDLAQPMIGQLAIKGLESRHQEPVLVRASN